MPGHDPASMNPGPWIAGQARNDSFLHNDSFPSCYGVALKP